MLEDKLIAESLKKEYGIEVRSLDRNILSDIKKMPISKDGVAQISAALSEVPILLSNAMLAGTLDTQVYSITLDGKNILPDELTKKKNGSYISNLKGDGRGFGKQTDINPIDNSMAKTAMIASSVFSIAAMATLQYYLKNINDRLSEIQKTTQSILNFIEQDKQSLIESDFEFLQDTIDCIDAIKCNETLKTMKIGLIGSIQRKAKSNIKFYKNEVNRLIHEYSANIIGGRTDYNNIEQIKSKYYYYRICLQEYALSKLLEIFLAENFEQKYLDSIKSDLESYSEDYKKENNHIFTCMYESSYSKIGAKAKSGLSNTLNFIGNVIQATPLGKTEIDEMLIAMGKDGKESIMKNTKKIVDQILVREDYGLLEPYVSIVKEMDHMRMKRVSLINDGNTLYLKID